jgi:trehalose transport system substrate-binding protein
MKNTFKIMTAVMVLALFATIMAGCAKKEEKVLSVTMGLGEVEWKVMRDEIFPPFEKKHGVRIEAFQVEPGALIQKLTAMHKADRMEIDLIAQDNMQLAPLVENGLVEDLTPFEPRVPGEVNKNLVEVGRFGGKLYFLPYRPNVEINFYNQKKFGQLGLTPPQTTDELLALARALKEKDGIGRVALKLTLDAATTVQLFEFICSFGGNPQVLNDAGSVAAFEYLKKLYPYLSPDSRTADWNTMNRYLATGAVYLGANWPFGVNVIVRDAGKKEIKAYSGWRGPVKKSKVLGGEVVGIPKGSANKKLALAFWEYLISKDVQEKLVAKMGWPSARTDAYATVEAWQAPYFEAVKEALKYTQPRPNLSYWATLDKSLNSAFREIVMEGRPIKETLDKYHQIVVAAASKTK